MSGTITREHVSYPHEPGRLYDCPACEEQCHCTTGSVECVWSGHEEEPIRILSVGRPAHLTEAEVRAEIRYRRDFDGMAEEISDACAVTISSWWQSPGSDGLAFAQLASTGTVAYDELSDAIFRARRGAYGFDADALDMLGTWAIAQLRVVEGW